MSGVLRTAMGCVCREGDLTTGSYAMERMTKTEPGPDTTLEHTMPTDNLQAAA